MGNQDMRMEHPINWFGTIHKLIFNPVSGFIFLFFIVNTISERESAYSSTLPQCQPIIQYCYRYMSGFLGSVRVERVGCNTQYDYYINSTYDPESLILYSNPLCNDVYMKVFE